MVAGYGLRGSTDSWVLLCSLELDFLARMDALKILKKRLGNTNTKTQLLALFVLETLSKNCGENVFQQIMKRDVLHDMVKVVKKKDVVIIDLFVQCCSYQKCVMILVNNTADEDLLCKGLALDDNLLRVLTQQEDIAKGTPMVSVGTRQIPVAPLMNVNHVDDESGDDFAQLAHRSSTDTQGQGPKPVFVKSERKPVSRVLPPPSSRKPTSINFGTVDFLSGDVYEIEKSPGTSESTILEPSPALSSSPTASLFAPKTTNDESAHTSKSSKQFSPAPWDVTSLDIHPSPPTRCNQRQQFFEQEYPYGSVPSHSSSRVRESRNPQ